MSLGGPRDKDGASTRGRRARTWVRFVLLTLYYLGILVGLVALYGRGDFSTPPFIYQNF
jgi:D-Ala-teichoic acid biosynthesis protein